MLKIISKGPFFFGGGSDDGGEGLEDVLLLPLAAALTLQREATGVIVNARRIPRLQF
jgi:hypothetical protein